MEAGTHYRSVAAIAGRALARVLAEKLSNWRQDSQDIAEREAMQVLNDQPDMAEHDAAHQQGVVHHTRALGMHEAGTGSMTQLLQAGSDMQEGQTSAHSTSSSSDALATSDSSGASSDKIRARYAKLRPLSFEEIMQWQHLPLEQAAEKCGLRATAFKKQCRRAGIRKWPYRQEKSRMKMEERMSVAAPVDPQTVGATRQRLRGTQPSTVSNPRTGHIETHAQMLSRLKHFKRLRQATYKHAHRSRQRAMEAASAGQARESSTDSEQADAALPIQDIFNFSDAAFAADTNMQAADQAELSPFMLLNGVDLPFSLDTDPLSNLFEMDVDMQAFPYNVLYSH